MASENQIIIAAKCAPDGAILGSIGEAGLGAVELYTGKAHLSRASDIVRICSGFPFRYAVHAPNEGEDWKSLAEVVNMLEAEIVVFHNIYWEDEWERILRAFEGTHARLCMENTHSVLEPLKFMKRYALGMCMDMEHLQIECAGYFEDGALPFVKMASHIHMTGYTFGSRMWHTHLHHSPGHCFHLLETAVQAGFSGMVVSEAKVSLQTLSEFKALCSFAEEWREREHSGFML